MEARARALVDRCRDRVGDSLRGIYVYGPDDHTIVYTRDDIDYGYTDDRLLALLESANQIHQSLQGMQTDKELLGAPEASVQVFEYAYVVQFLDDQHGIAVSIDDDAASELSTLVRECTAVLQDAD